MVGDLTPAEFLAEIRPKCAAIMALVAIAEGYPVRGVDDCLVVVENPNYQPDNGSDPNLVIDLIALAADRRRNLMPRPKVINEPAECFNVLLPVRLIDQLRSKAFKEGTHVGALIRKAVQEKYPTSSS